MNSLAMTFSGLTRTLEELARPRVRIVTRSYGRDELFGSPKTTLTVCVEGEGYFTCTPSERAQLMRGVSAEDLELSLAPEDEI